MPYVSLRELLQDPFKSIHSSIHQRYQQLKQVKLIFEYYILPYVDMALSLKVKFTWIVGLLS